jgi:ribose transport system substrate-binding protein
MKKLTIGIVAVASVVALSGCSTGTSAGGSAATGSDATYAYVSPNTGNSFHISAQCGVVRAAKDLGVKLEVQGASAFSADAQIPVLQAVAAKNPSALITTATDSKALETPLQQIKDAGTHVVLYDSGVDDESIPDAFVGADNVGGGKILAEQVGKDLNGKGLILPIDLNPGVVSTNDRAKGFLEGIKEFPGITVLDTQYDAYTPSKTTQIVDATLSAHPELTAVVPMYNDGAIAALSTLTQTDAGSKVKVFTFDADPAIVKDIKAGTIQAAVTQQPYKEGRQALEAAIAAVNGKKIDPKTQLIPMLLVTKENVDDPQLAKDGFYVDKACS